MKKPSNNNILNIDDSDSHAEDTVESEVNISTPQKNEPISNINGNDFGQILEDYEAGSLSNAKAKWYFGEWQDLIEIDIGKLNKHPDIAKFAALKAAAYQQLNDSANCEKYIRLARKLGCDNRSIAQLLVAGIHNTLGKIAALKQDDKSIVYHFDAAISLGDNRQDNKLARHARSVKEIAKLGLLPQAAKLIEEEAAHVNSLASRPGDNDAQLTMLTSEIGLLNQELTLAHQKSQLYTNINEEKTIYDIDGRINKKRLKQLSPSQLGQDLWVLEKTNFKRNGFFVEFGATNGVLLSNTYLLEKQFDWKGICAEPNSDYFNQLVHNRKCIVDNACISGLTGEQVKFVLANEYSGIIDFANQDKHADKRNAYMLSKNIVSMTTISLNDFLLKHNAPIEIDYLSIDTEGNELEILEQFPFDRWQIKLLSIEHNFTSKRKAIQDLLTNKGYCITEAKWDDWYYLQDNR